MGELFIDHWIKWLLGIISGIMGGVMTLLSRRIKYELAEQALLKEGMLALMHDRLYALCNEHIEKRYISTSDLKNIEKIYKSYHALGGNGTGDTLFEKVNELSIKN